MQMEEKAYMTVTDVAKELEITPATVYQWAKQGKLPVHKAGKLVRVKREDLDKFMSGEKPVVVPEDTQVGEELLAVLRRFIREEMRS
jgi:excisionase family DNA binding protein